jgi:hypothetical protein
MRRLTIIADLTSQDLCLMKGVASGIEIGDHTLARAAPYPTFRCELQQSTPDVVRHGLSTPDRVVAVIVHHGMRRRAK